MTEIPDRREAARRRAELAASGRRGEAAAAQRLVDAFVAEAGANGLAPVALQALTTDGRRLRTDRRGWYLNARQTLAIGEAGEWYSLTVPAPGLFARWRPVQLVASDPELFVGRGGRDGESGDLADFLARVLDGTTRQGG